MRIAIIQSNYIPWIGYFDIINSVDHFVFYDCVQYTKNDWRNRNKIKTKEGLKWLTIPIKQSTLSDRIDNKEISDMSFIKKHLNSLKANYAKTPYFKTYFPLLEEVLLNELSGEMNLSRFNQRLTRLICEILEIKTVLIDSKELTFSGDRNQKLVDICSGLNAGIYLSGTAAQGYIDEALFLENNIVPQWADYDYEEYTQEWPPFSAYVSILDPLFNVGKEGVRKLFRQKSS